MNGKLGDIDSTATWAGDLDQMKLVFEWCSEKTPARRVSGSDVRTINAARYPGRIQGRVNDSAKSRL
jgi:hypothetical protein